MFAWAPIPEEFQAMGSLEFAKYLVQEAKVAVSPGVGFGLGGDVTCGSRWSRTNNGSVRRSGG